MFTIHTFRGMIRYIAGSRGEMDIIAAFEAVVGGSNPSGSTKT